MSAVAFLGAIEIGFIYGLVAVGVYLSFRVLNFPDLTVDGSFPLGAAVAAALIVKGVDPYLATLAALFSGACAGLVTAMLNVRFKILHLLASILTMIALFSINLRIMGRPNIALINEPSVLELPFLEQFSDSLTRPLVAGALILVVVVLVASFLSSEFGLGMRATGANPRMAEAQGVETKRSIYLGMALSNAVVALAGAFFAQANGFADVTIGTGTIVVGLAAVILGETVLPFRGIWWGILACVVGSLLYRIAVAFALNADFAGLQSSDLNLVTAVLVGLALVIPGVRNPFRLPRRRTAIEVSPDQSSSR